MREVCLVKSLKSCMPESKRNMDAEAKKGGGAVAGPLL